jgi:hypothetical protein
VRTTGLSQWRAWTGSNLSHRYQTGDYYENAYPRSDSPLTDVHRSCSSLTCLSRLGTGRPHHVPVTGHHFTGVSGLYTTNDFVTVMLTLPRPLPANMPFTSVAPTAFTFFDGVQTISNTPNVEVFFDFATNARGEITLWFAQALANDPDFRFIGTTHDVTGTGDGGGGDVLGLGFNNDSPGVWSVNASVPDAGSTITLMTLTLTALGLVARRFWAFPVVKLGPAVISSHRFQTGGLL